MAIEKISEVIARKAAEKIENEFDKLLMEAMAQDSAKYNRDSAYYTMGNSYGQFLKGLNDAAEVPEQYSFDLNLLMEIASDDQEAEPIRYYLSRSEAIFGMQTAKSEDNWQFIVYDMDKDVTVLYQHDGDKKTAQALPNMMKLAAGLAQNQGGEATDHLDFKINKTSRKERIAGYKCEVWEGTSEEQDFEAWITDDLGVDWSTNFSQMASQFTSSQDYSDAWEQMDGLALKSISFDGESKNIISRMEVKEVSKKAFVINNSEYTFGYE